VTQADDDTAQLADRLGVPYEWCVELLGTGWVRLHDDPDAWYVKGEPPQLMVRACVDGVVIARPVGDWSGHELVYRAEDRVRLGLHDLPPERAAEMKRLLAARRRRFRWCPSCWRHQPPERMFGPDACMSCARVVF